MELIISRQKILFCSSNDFFVLFCFCFCFCKDHWFYCEDYCFFCTDRFFFVFFFKFIYRRVAHPICTKDVTFVSSLCGVVAFLGSLKSLGRSVSIDKNKTDDVRLTRRTPSWKWQLASDWLIPGNISKQARKIERKPIREILREMHAAMIAAKWAFPPGNLEVRRAHKTAFIYSCIY